jgi:hypothetical protein
MSSNIENPDNLVVLQKSTLNVGFYSAILTAVITLVTFGFAINAVPTSGANCLAGCFVYPYLDTISQFPKDYIWMPLAILMIFAYVVLMVSIQAYASRDRKIFGQIGLSFAIMATLILVGDYFVQFSVVPVSLMHGETEGITMLTQYNSHGPFIVLEELGYLMMTLSFLFIAPVFVGRNRLKTAIRWIFVIGFILSMVFLVVVSVNHGLNRQDRFEVAIISIDWLILVINGILLGILFKKQLLTVKQPLNAKSES